MTEDELFVCPICYESGNPIALLCKHEFHFKCIERWRNGAFEFNCPLCRNVSFADDYAVERVVNANYWDWSPEHDLDNSLHEYTAPRAVLQALASAANKGRQGAMPHTYLGRWLLEGIHGEQNYRGGPVIDTYEVYKYDDTSFMVLFCNSAQFGPISGFGPLFVHS